LTLLDGLRITSNVRPRADRFGERRSRSVGGYAEFVDYRPYVPGDDLRLVDWNVAARTDRLFVKQRARETGLPVHLLLDASRSMTVGSPSPFETGNAFALGFAYIALRHGDFVSVTGFGDSVGATTRASGFGSLPIVANALSRAVPYSGTNFGRALRGYATRSRGHAVAVVLSDLLDPRGFEDGVRAMSARGFEVFLIHIVSRELERPDLSDDVRLTDSETGEFREVTWNADALEAYTIRVNRYLKRAEDWCRANRVPYARVQAGTSLGDAFHKSFRIARMIGT
jgi:uncharacterized protein (DUF58 family)